MTLREQITFLIENEFERLEEWAHCYYAKPVKGRGRFISKAAVKAIQTKRGGPDFLITLAKAPAATMCLTRSSLLFTLPYEGRALNGQIGASFNYTWKAWELKFTSFNEVKAARKRIFSKLFKAGYDPVIFAAA